MRLDVPDSMSQFLHHAVRKIEHVAEGGYADGEGPPELTPQTHPNSPPESPLNLYPPSASLEVNYMHMFIWLYFPRVPTPLCTPPKGPRRKGKQGT